jgi:hypothetical protein
MRSPSSTRMLQRASVAALTALTLLAPPVRAAEPAAASDEAIKLDKARTLYAADQYLPAAEIFEDLHARSKNPQYLYYAGLAREGAGHEAHAIRHWQTALTLGLDPEFKPKAETRLAQAKARTAAFTVTVDPPGLATDATLELTPASGNRRTISLPLADLPVHLDPGDWIIKFTPKNSAYSPEELTLNVPRGTQQISQKISPKAALHPVIFELTPKPANLSDRGIKVTIKDPDGLTPDQPIPVTENPFTADLRPGTWHYTLETPGHPPITNTFTVTANTSIVPIPLAAETTRTQRPPHQTDPQKTRPRPRRQLDRPDHPRRSSHRLGRQRRKRHRQPRWHLGRRISQSAQRSLPRRYDPDRRRRGLVVRRRSRQFPHISTWLVWRPRRRTRSRGRRLHMEHRELCRYPRSPI